jgi:hypothetical protein
VPSGSQVGYDVTLLTDDDLDRGDFAKYDAIVTGVRAYNAWPRMRLAHPKLMSTSRTAARSSSSTTAPTAAAARRRTGAVSVR